MKNSENKAGDLSPQRFLDFCDGDLTVSAQEIIGGVAASKMSMASTAKGGLAIVCLNHPNAVEIIERISEMIDYFDDQSELSEAIE